MVTTEGYRDAMTTTLGPHVHRYLTGRVRRGEITTKTAASYRYRLHQFATSFGRRPIDQLGPAAIDRWLEQIGHRAPATRREYLSVVRVFCRWMVAQGAIASDPTGHVAAIPQPRRAPVTLTAAEVAAVLAHAPDVRARAIVWLMVGCGTRCVEVARLRVEDYDPRGLTVRLVGKGGHERVIPVPSGAARALDAYLDEVGRCAGPLFRSRRDGGPIRTETMSRYVRAWMIAAGVKVRPLDGRSAHGLRRTAGSDVMDRSGDLRAVQEMLGHASIETTARHYLRLVSMEQLREAMAGRDYTAA